MNQEKIVTSLITDIMIWNMSCIFIPLVQVYITYFYNKISHFPPLSYLYFCVSGFSITWQFTAYLVCTLVSILLLIIVTVIGAVAAADNVHYWKEHPGYHHYDDYNYPDQVRYLLTSGVWLQGSRYAMMAPSKINMVFIAKWWEFLKKKCYIMESTSWVLVGSKGTYAIMLACVYVCVCASATLVWVIDNWGDGYLLYLLCTCYSEKVSSLALWV